MIHILGDYVCDTIKKNKGYDIAIPSKQSFYVLKGVCISEVSQLNIILFTVL